MTSAFAHHDPYDLALARIDTADRCLDYLGQQLLDIATRPARSETLKQAADYARTVMKYLKGLGESFTMRQQVTALKNKSDERRRRRERAAELDFQREPEGYEKKSALDSGTDFPENRPPFDPRK